MDTDIQIEKLMRDCNYTNRRRRRRKSDKLKLKYTKSKTSFYKLHRIGQKILKKNILKEFKEKQATVERMLYDDRDDKARTSKLMRIIDTSSELCKNVSLEVSAPSIMDEIPIDPYYAQNTQAPMFVRPKWRRRRPMVPQNKWRRRPGEGGKKVNYFLRSGGSSSSSSNRSSNKKHSDDLVPNLRNVYW
jgi:hypothetical protein